MIEKIYLLLLLIIIQASCNNVRFLTDSTDNCTKYKFMDSQGNLQDQDCNGCTKVCQ